MQTADGEYSGLVLERFRIEERTRQSAGHQRLLPWEYSEGWHVFRGTAHARRRSHGRWLDRGWPGGKEVRPVHEDHRRSAHRPIRRPRASIAEHLGGVGQRRLRERPCLRQGAAHSEKLRRHDLVPLRRAGLRGFRHPGREPLQGRPGAAQGQISRFGLRARMCGGAEQGLRHHRHGKGLEPLRMRLGAAVAAYCRSTAPSPSAASRPSR